MNESTKNTSSSRIFGLDIIRAIAIIAVVWVHGGSFLYNTILSDFPYFGLVDGVDLFFVLSGFLIGGILLKEINLLNFQNLLKVMYLCVDEKVKTIKDRKSVV